MNKTALKQAKEFRLPYSDNAWLITLVLVTFLGPFMYFGFFPAFPLTTQSAIAILVATLGGRLSGLLSGLSASSLMIFAYFGDIGLVGEVGTPFYISIAIVWTVGMSFYLGWIREGQHRALQEAARRQTPPETLNGNLRAERDDRTRELELVKDRLIASQNRLRDVTKRWIDAQEQERRKLARELHDDIGQNLTALRISLESKKSLFPESPEARGQIESWYKLVDELISSTREMSVALRPSLLDDMGLVAALREYIPQRLENAEIDCDFNFRGDESAISPQHKISVYRVTQEILDYLISDSGASEVTLSVDLSSDDAIIHFHDNGAGHVDENPDRLASIRERASIMGGSVSVTSVKGRGTDIKLLIPTGSGAGEDLAS